MQFLRKYKGALILFAAVLVIAVGWVLIWQRIGDQLGQAGTDAAFETVTLDGAYYTKCSDTVLARYVSDAAADHIGEALNAPAVVDTPAGKVSCKAYRCRELAEAGLRDAVIFVAREDTLTPYELTGFVSLGTAPDISAVLAAYGIASAADIAAVEVCDADGTLLDTITETDAAASFYSKLTALGSALSEDDISARYYAAYVAEYGETDDIAIVGGEVVAADDAVYEQAMTVWSRGLCLVNLRLQNGLQLRNTVYMPGAGIYTFYASYALEVPFFA